MKKLETINLLWSILNAYQKRLLYKLLCFITLSSSLELFTIGSIVPFLHLISGTNTNNQIIQLYKLVANLIPFVNEIFLASFLLISLASFSTFIRIYTLKLNFKFSSVIGNHLATKCVENYLKIDYEEHITKNTNEIVSLISVQLQGAVDTIRYFVQFIIAILTTIFVVTGLLIYNFNSIILFIISGLIYLYIAIKTRKKLNKNSEVYSNSSAKQVSLLKETLSSFKQIKIDGSDKYFVKLIQKVDLDLRKSIAESGILITFTRFILEGVITCFIILYTLFLYKINDNSFINIIPYIGTLTFGLTRTLPVIQQIYASISVIRSYKSSLIKVLNLAKTKDINEFNISNSQNKYISSNKILMQKNLILKNISYKYKSSNNLVLNKINLTINKGEKLLILGETGSGKSTLIDIISGLIVPQEGDLLIDNKSYYKNDNSGISLWRSNISLVPQKIFLLDNSIIKNIAFGLYPNDIDINKVIKCCKIAKIHDYIEELPEKYETRLGDDGIKLSGGQRQRIIIARALYRKAEIIIFDEATSALDKKTELEVMNNLRKYLKNTTLIFISHNSQSKESFEKIIEIKNKKIKIIK